MSIVISPVSDTIVRVEIFDVQVILNKTAMCKVFCYNADGVVVKTLDSALTEGQYLEWGAGPQSDDYFIDCILSNLGFVRHLAN